jgi:hypothetical protein
MNKFKWFFMSKYKKLMYKLECAKANKQTFHMNNGIVINFKNNTISYEHTNK